MTHAHASASLESFLQQAENGRGRGERVLSFESLNFLQLHAIPYIPVSRYHDEG